MIKCKLVLSCDDFGVCRKPHVAKILISAYLETEVSPWLLNTLILPLMPSLLVKC